MDNPAWEIEYTTYGPLGFGNESEIDGNWRMIPAPLMREGSLPEAKLPYRMKDGTIGSWLAVAREIGEDERLQKVFHRLMYMEGTGDE